MQPTRPDVLGRRIHRRIMIRSLKSRLTPDHVSSIIRPVGINATREGVRNRNDASAVLVELVPRETIFFGEEFSASELAELNVGITSSRLLG